MESEYKPFFKPKTSFILNIVFAVFNAVVYYMAGQLFSLVVCLICCLGAYSALVSMEKENPEEKENE